MSGRELGLGLGRKKQDNQKKRKFLDIWSSRYIQPSKYLLINNEDNDTTKLALFKSPPISNRTIINDHDDDSSSLNLSDSKTSASSLNRIGDDCLMVVIGFLDLDELCSCIGVSKYWAQLVIPYFLGLTKGIYENSEHLERLREYGMENDMDEIRGALFTELATWKSALCYDQLADGDEIVGNFSDNEDVVEHNDCDFRRKLIPFGSPLCKGTIGEQFDLVQDEIDLLSYKELVEKILGMKQEEQDVYEINPFVYYEKINHEAGMIDSYIDEVQESLHVDCGNPIWCDGVPYYAGEDGFEHIQIDYTEFPFFALRSGISRLAKQAGLLFYEPSFIEDALYQMKKLIYLVIKDAYETKFPNKTQDLEFEESYEQYSLFCPIPEENHLCFDDRLDSDKKLSSVDILNSFKKVTDKQLFFAEQDDPYGVKESNSNMEQNYEPEIVPESVTNDEELQLDNNEDENDSSSSEDECFSESEEDDIVEETADVNPSNITEENFIDDESSNNFTFDLDNLGDTLPELLMRVSIKVHEEVYGNERAHKEKLYLKNWYGNGEYFFSNCSTQIENPTRPNQEEDPIPENDKFWLTERQQIEIDKKEDVEYFGYSLYEDDFDEFPIVSEEEDHNSLEQATEEESLRYHLRRMLREQSYECITNYFTMLT